MGPVSKCRKNNVRERGELKMRNKRWGKERSTRILRNKSSHTHVPVIVRLMPTPRVMNENLVCDKKKRELNCQTMKTKQEKDPLQAKSPNQPNAVSVPKQKRELTLPR
jgi:hypothetical protein